ncbi:MAG TPA: inner membrane CreD family protein [Candidatus Acidoferrales bacterium]|jgi:inner membrane protein involved in colicin E2 resistance|nr:inner membrane CreD family protein [Candidatus Acidoferrales bacterium]
MIKRIGALVFIFVCTSIAWMVLGTTIVSRSYSPLTDELKSRVASNWGTAQEQAPPIATYKRESISFEGSENDPKQMRTNHVAPLPLEATKVDVTLDLQHRQKGLLWYSTYTVLFEGDYDFTNVSGQDQDVTFQLSLPSKQAVYDDLLMSVDNQPLTVTNANNTAFGSIQVPAGKTVVLHASYRSQGLDTWRYNFGDGVSQIRNFTLNVHTDFKDVDFPENTLSPTTKRETAKGWDLSWNYTNLVSGYAIGIAMPQKLQPGPLAGQISFFAPVSLFFFFFLMFIITTLRGIDLHPMNYFFLAAAFFAFHLLLAYLVDHLSIHIAFVVCSLVSICLVVSYLRLVVGLRFAALEAGLAQLIYLVLFSYAFFFQGFTGLAITIGSIVTLFVVMQATGRIRWEEKFAQLQS